MQHEPIKGEGSGVQIPLLLPQHPIHHLNLQAKCLTHCLIAENGAHPNSPLVIMENATQVGEEGRIQAGAPHWHAGKEEAESSMAEEKHVLVIMTGVREPRRPQFLAVGQFLSVLLVTSKQQISHMKKV